MDFLDFPDITAEVKGAMVRATKFFLYFPNVMIFELFFCYIQTPGKLKLTDQNLIFKNQKTGKVEQIAASDMDMVNFQKFVGTWGLRIFLKNGTLHRFRGFRESVSINFQILSKIPRNF